MIGAIIFDLDDTLYSEREYVGGGFRAVSSHLENVPNAYSKLWAAFENGEQAIDWVLHGEGIYSDELKEQCLHVYRNHRPELQLYDGVRELLINLKGAGIKTGIITDGRPRGQDAKIASLGLNELIDEVIITDNLGGVRYRKPDCTAFEIMRDRLGVPCENMVYVGDNWRKDYFAAHSLGIKFMYFINADGLYSENIEIEQDVDSFRHIDELGAILLAR